MEMGLPETFFHLSDAFSNQSTIDLSLSLRHSFQALPSSRCHNPIIVSISCSIAISYHLAAMHCGLTSLFISLFAFFYFLGSSYFGVLFPELIRFGVVKLIKLQKYTVFSSSPDSPKVVF
jgi:hypothetical protein